MEGENLQIPSSIVVSWQMHEEILLLGLIWYFCARAVFIGNSLTKTYSILVLLKELLGVEGIQQCIRNLSPRKSITLCRFTLL